MKQVKFKIKTAFNPLSANPTKWSKHTQTIRRQQSMNCLSVFDHFVNLALKGLKSWRLYGLNKPCSFEFFTGCLRQVLLSPFLNILFHMYYIISKDLAENHQPFCKVSLELVRRWNKRKRAVTLIDGLMAQNLLGNYWFSTPVTVSWLFFIWLWKTKDK